MYSSRCGAALIASEFFSKSPIFTASLLSNSMNLPSWEWNGMESHGSVSVTKRQSRHKTTSQSLWRAPLGARSELQSNPLPEQAQACGRLTKAERPEGPIALFVTTRRLPKTKKPWNLVVPPDIGSTCSATASLRRSCPRGCLRPSAVSPTI